MSEPDGLAECDPRQVVASADALTLLRARELAREVREINGAWELAQEEVAGECGGAPLRSMTPHEELEGVCARMAWKVATALARELLG